MSVDHYENFPVASILLPQPLRRPVELIYRFARTADDIADEGSAGAAERLQQLEELHNELSAIEAGQEPKRPWMRDLADVIREFRLPLQPFRELLSAFSQDVVRIRYNDFAELLDYCRRSANPIGRLLLILYRADTPANNACSDAVCSALQLINFLQDVAIDWAKNRVYFPANEMAQYGISVEQIARGDTGGAWRAFMAFEVSRARQLLLSGAPLGRRLAGRIGLELRMIVQGGDRILDKIEAVHGDVFRRRPVLRWYDWPVIALRAL